MSTNEAPIEPTGNWSTFEPREYLEMWYTQPTPEITATLDFLQETYRHVAPDALVLDICCGPTIYQYMAAASMVAEIHGADFLERNLDEIRMWRAAQPGSHSWDAILAEALRLEGIARPTQDDIDCRAALVREKLTRLAWIDVRQRDIFGEPAGRSYDVLSNCYGTDVIANTLEEWNAYLANACAVLKPGGMLIMTLIKEAQWWPSGDQILPALALNETHVVAALTQLGFDPESIALSTHTVEDASEAGYSDIIFVTATLFDHGNAAQRSA